ncbi:MAG TPA: hypothetical protein VD887_10880 [Allosphingosinicella sp.]|nr:hypothetical protein [Allosphingosinicella sp.]
MHAAILRPALLLACLGMAAQGSAQLSPGTGRAGERTMPAAEARAAIRACGNPNLAAGSDLPADAVGVLAYGLLNPGWAPPTCKRRDPQAALALLEAYAGDPLRRDAGRLALWRLFELYGDRTDARARTRRDAIRRLLWLRGQYEAAADDKLLTRAERDRLLSDPDAVAFLRQWVALLPSDPDPRRRLAAALLLAGSPSYDPLEAASVLPGGAPERLRLRLLQALLADERTFAAALEQLPRLHIQPYALAGEDVLLIEAIVARAAHLFRQGGEPHWTTGARVLAALAEADLWQARSALQSAVDRAGCCLVTAGFPPELRVRRLSVSDEDYPAAADRARVAGIVQLAAIYGPDGRLLWVDAGPGEPSLLRRAAVALWRRRALRDVELQGHRGHYVRVRGPTVEFRLPRCDMGVAQPLPPPDPDVVTIDARCPRSVYY